MRPRPFFALALWALACAPASSEDFRVLVFSKTGGFRHDSIPNGIALIRTLGAAHGFAVEATEDASRFTRKNLGAYRGRAWYTNLGHRSETYSDPSFAQHLLGGILWAGARRK